jgi:hypothetical protein
VSFHWSAGHERRGFLPPFGCHGSSRYRPLLHGELDGLLQPLSQAERRDVRDMLAHAISQSDPMMRTACASASTR